MSRPKNGSTDIEDFIEKYESKYMVYVDERGNKWWNSDCVLKLIALLYQHQMNKQKEVSADIKEMQEKFFDSSVGQRFTADNEVWFTTSGLAGWKLGFQVFEWFESYLLNNGCLRWNGELLTLDKFNKLLDDRFNAGFEAGKSLSNKKTIKKFKTFKSMMRELNELNRKYKKEKTKGNITISLPIRGNL